MQQAELGDKSTVYRLPRAEPRIAPLSSVHGVITPPFARIKFAARPLTRWILFPFTDGALFRLGFAPGGRAGALGPLSSERPNAA